MVLARRLTTLLTMLSTVVAVSSCSTSGQDPPAGVDLARLTEVSGAFPPGLTPDPPSAPTTLAPEYAHLVGDTVSYGKPFTVDPPQCRPLFKPVEAQADAEKMGIGAGGPQRPVLAVSAVDPVTVPVPLPSTGCDHMSFEVAGAVPDGTAERLTAPQIDGAVTNGLRVLHDEGAEYFYTAILDGRTYVLVTARMGHDFQAEPLLPDLLRKAVDAIRG